MDITELEELIINQDKISPREIDKKLRDAGVSMKIIPSRISHDYIRIARLYEGTINQSSNVKYKNKNYSILHLVQDKSFQWFILDSKSVKEFYLKEDIAIINQKFKKHPTLKNRLISYIQSLPQNYCLSQPLQVARAIYQIYIDNKDKIKEYSIYVNDYPLTSRGIESLYDDIMKATKDHELIVFTRQFFSKKTEYLINSLTFKSCEILMESNITKQEIEDGFFKKLSRYKDPETFNLDLSEFASRLNKWTHPNIIQKIKQLNLSIVVEEDKKILVEINTYKKLKQLGSQSWCIVTSESYFKEYMTGLNRQFVLYDFSFDYTNSKFMTGITTDAFGNYQVGHNHYDEKLKESEYDKLQTEILYKIPPNSENKIVDRLNDSIKGGTRQNQVIDNIIYYNLQDFAKSWIKNKNLSNNEQDCIIFSKWLINKDYQFYLKHIDRMPINDIFNLGQIVSVIDNQYELPIKDLSLLLKHSQIKDQWKGDLIKKLETKINKVEYFNIIESIKNEDFYDIV